MFSSREVITDLAGIRRMSDKPQIKAVPYIGY